MLELRGRKPEARNQISACDSAVDAETRLLLLASCFLFLSACSATYSKESLIHSVQKLFFKELGVETRSKLVGKTLYVSFQIENLVTKGMTLSEEVASKLEKAMLSIIRIALSTDAQIDVTVIQATDRVWGVTANLIRRTQDVKDFLYWRISKPDFDERLILEINSADQSDARDWQDISLPEFMGRWVAFRLTFGTRSNPFLNLLLDFEKMKVHYDNQKKSLYLIVSSTAALTSDLLKSTVEEQLSLVEKKYLERKGEWIEKNWVEKVLVQNSNGQTILEIRE